MANWIHIDDRWHIIGRVDARGWVTVCGEIVNGPATVVDEEPPADGEWQCLRCIALEEEPVP